MLPDKALIWRADHVFVVGRFAALFSPKARACVISCVFVYLVEISERKGVEFKGITCYVFIFAEHGSGYGVAF